MYATKVSEIENLFLHDAAYCCELRGLQLRSIHMDPSGECAISYWGCLDLTAIAGILQNYLPDDVPFEECYKMVTEGDYYKWFPSDTKEHPNGFIQVYTPDGIDYRELDFRLRDQLDIDKEFNKKLS